MSLVPIGKLTISNSLQVSVSQDIEIVNKMGFKGYKWSGLSTFSDGSSWHQRASRFLMQTDWTALCDHASKIYGTTCILDPQITMGGRHMVRILNFADGSRWIARLRMRLQLDLKSKKPVNFSREKSIAFS